MIVCIQLFGSFGCEWTDLMYNARGKLSCSQIPIWTLQVDSLDEQFYMHVNIVLHKVVG